MPVPPSTPNRGEEPTYSRSVFEAILAGMGAGDDCANRYVVSEDGARVKDLDAAGSLAWHPWCEVMTPGSPNPLDEPWLRFPFTARQLAALMTDGWGYFIQEKYGDWHDGPDEDELSDIGLLGGKAKEALRAAYGAYRHAVEMAPRLDRSVEDKAQKLALEYDSARKAAIAREGLREHGVSDAEYTARLARLNEGVADLKAAAKDARQAANLAHSRWRRAVVQHLLLPIDEVAAESFEDPILRALPSNRRAEALHMTQAQQAFMDSDEGKAYWDLICEKDRIESEQRRWQLMHPQSITEAVLQEAKLKDLAVELTTVMASMRAIEGAPLTETPLDYARLATREDLLSAFGSFGCWRRLKSDPLTRIVPTEI